MQNEGFRSKPYKCSEGVWSIGYGCNLERRMSELPSMIRGWVRTQGIEGGYIKYDMPIHNLNLNIKEASDILQEDLTNIVQELLTKVPWVEHLPETARDIVYDMAYNLGVPGLLNFKKMFFALFNSDWRGASNEMLDSKWAKQVGKRATKQAEEMANLGVGSDWMQHHIEEILQKIAENIHRSVDELTPKLYDELRYIGYEA